jgi:hypothetical protein
MATGAANVLTKLAHPEVIMDTIMPFARMSSNMVSNVETWRNKRLKTHWLEPRQGK